MAGKIMNFIDKANRVMFFITLLLVASGLGYIAVKELTRDTYRPPTVKVVDDNNKEKIRVKTTKNYIGKLKDVHIFEVAKDTVIKNSSHKVQYDYSGYSGVAISANAVNLIFTKAGEKAQLLLTDDALIHEFSKVHEDHDRGYLLSKNLYILIKHDTNGDGVLNDHDQRDFYISDYDGDNLTMMKENMSHYKVIDNDTVIVHSKTEDNKQLFELFNVYTGAFELLDTQL